MRVYRNALVEFIRGRLTNAFADKAPDQIAALFGKLDEKTGATRWTQMRDAAERARATPEVSTSVSDDFELLGVADFFAVFEKFYDHLFPEHAEKSKEWNTEFRTGVLRCARQIKVARDPTSHEVTEDSGIDEIILTVSNIIVLLKACGCEAEARDLRALLQGQLASKPQHTVSIIKATGSNGSSSEAIARRLEARGIKPTRIELSPQPPEDDNETVPTLPAQTNILVVIDGYPHADSEIGRCMRLASRQGKKMIVITQTADGDWPTAAAQLGVTPSSRVVFHPEYAAEAVERIVSRLAADPPRSSRSDAKAPSVPVAEAVLDHRLRVQLATELANPNLRRVWLVSPFASDVGNWVLRSQQLSKLLAEQRGRGVEVTIITRPPTPPENPVEKRAFLDRLENNDVSVLLNDNLHAKIYLFDASPARVRWFVGSHNLTESGLGKWREASMAGSRQAEYQQAHNAMVSVRDDPNTERYHIWKSRETRRSGRP